MKSLEQEYILYRGDVLRLAEGFCWLADSLAAIAESVCWKKKRKEDLKQIILLSERLIEGIEEGLNLARLYIPGLSRHYIRRLLGVGYNNGKSLKEASGEELNKILSKKLVNRIQERIKEEKVMQEVKKQKLIVETENCKPIFITILEIDQHRPDRIIFMGEKIEVTATEFSLIHLLAQHNGQVMSYDELLDELWRDEEDAIYNRVSFHISKIRRTILKVIEKRKTNEEKVKNIFVVVPKRGVMLKLKAEEIKMN